MPFLGSQRPGIQLIHHVQTKHDMHKIKNPVCVFTGFRPSLCSFCPLIFFKTGFICVALTVLELTLEQAS